jgi:uncharacterized NAD-dependent epimerase/dehydratase family protein
MTTETAAVLANGLLQTPFAKTTHGMVRGPSRYRILGVIDPDAAGRDAGELLDGEHRAIPVFESLSDLTAATGETPDVCVVGVATVGGVLPDEIRAGLVEAAAAGMTLVNGLHHLLSDDPELARLTRERGGRIIDIRRPRPISELRFWSGEALDIPTPRIAVLGTDCAVGKRPTAALLSQACEQRGIRSEMIYTGQTGWLQGMPYGFIFDATPNDFVCGELERAIVDCDRGSQPDVMFLEGQSGLRNPAGPCGSELILAGGAKGVVLQHVPGRRFYEDLDRVGCEIPPVTEEIDMIRLMGSAVWALTLNDEGLDEEKARKVQRQLTDELQIPVVFPLWDGVETVVDEIQQRLGNGEDSQ